MMRRVFRFSIFTIAVLFSSNSHAAATCFCDVSTNNLYGAPSASGVFMSFTGNIGLSFTGLFQQGEDKQVFCQATCKATAEAIGKPAIRDAACAAQAQKGASGLVPIRAYSKVGTKVYRVAADFGEVLYTPEVKQTTCICPTGWLSNSSNAPNGITTDGRCKKLSGTYSGTVFPNGTQIGSNNEAFTWGNEIWIYGTPSNGGKAFCSTAVTQPAICM